MVCSNPDTKCNWMNVKPLLREIYQACKYFLASEVPRISHCHLSSRQMCIAVSCCGRVLSQSVQKEDGLEAQSWDKIVSAPFLRTADHFLPSLSTSLHCSAHLSIFGLPASFPREPCRCALRPEESLLCTGVGLCWSGATKFKHLL